MADSIKLPVQLFGIDKAFQEIISKHNATIAHSKNAAAQLAQTTEQLTRKLEAQMHKLGVTTGSFKTTGEGVATGRTIEGKPETVDISVTANMEALTKKRLTRLARIASEIDAAGATSWSIERRTEFANDPENLVAVASGANRSKGDKDAYLWLPPNIANCTWYLEARAKVWAKYGVEIDPEEKKSAAFFADKWPLHEQGIKQ